MSKSAFVVFIVLIVLSAPCRSPGSTSFQAVYDSGEGQLVLDLAIGDDGDDDYLFYRLSDLCIDAHENIIVVDSGLPSVRKYDSEGNHIYSIDSVGEGPGDIGLPTKIMVLPENEVAVFDLRNRRISIFDSDGEYNHSVKFQEIVWKCASGPGGDMFLETRLSDFEGTRGGELIRIVRLSDDYQRITVVDSALIKTNTYVTGPVSRNIPVPFRETMGWAVAPSGNVVVARSNSYSTKIYSVDLGMRAEFTHHGKRTKVTEDDKEKYFAGMSHVTDGVYRKGPSDYVRDATEFPGHKQYFARMLIDHEGFILFQTYGQVGEKFVYDVFTPEGKFINQVLLPELHWSCILAQGLIYQLHIPDEEAPAIHRYRVETAKDKSGGVD